jgi:hypothetical protein
MSAQACSARHRVSKAASPKAKCSKSVMVTGIGGNIIVTAIGGTGIIAGTGTV